MKRRHPKAFLLLDDIATHARRTPGDVTTKTGFTYSLNAGDAIVSSYSECGYFETKKEWRCALDVLRDKYRQITTRTLGSGYAQKVVATIASNGIFDINIDIGAKIEGNKKRIDKASKTESEKPDFRDQGGDQSMDQGQKNIGNKLVGLNSDSEILGTIQGTKSGTYNNNEGNNNESNNVLFPKSTKKDGAGAPDTSITPYIGEAIEKTASCKASQTTASVEGNASLTDDKSIEANLLPVTEGEAPSPASQQDTLDFAQDAPDCFGSHQEDVPNCQICRKDSNNIFLQCCFMTYNGKRRVAPDEAVGTQPTEGLGKNIGLKSVLLWSA